MTSGRAAEVRQPVHVVHHLEEVMGTIVVIDVYADNAAEQLNDEVSGQLAEAVAILPNWCSRPTAACMFTDAFMSGAI